MHRGFTLFFALLVSSFALAIGVSIFDITLRELALSQAATQSQYAIYAADSGAECALYWDNKYAGNALGTAFATSTAYTGVAANSSILCNGADITASAAWSVVTSATAATTTFGIQTTASAPCTTVVVTKSGNPSQTTVTAHGYNTCTAGPLQFERVFQTSY